MEVYSATFIAITQAAWDLVEMSREADIVIVAGDFRTMRKGLLEIIDVLSGMPYSHRNMVLLYLS